MKRIGILIGSTYCDRYLYQIASELSKSNHIALYFLLSENVTAQQPLWGKIRQKVQSKEVSRLIDSALFWFLTITEAKILLARYPDIREYHKKFSIDKFIKNTPITLNPIFSPSGLVVRYPDQDIEHIESLGLDLLIRGNAQGIYKGRILNAAKDGIISFHHGDNRWNRGGPPAFWEVYFRKPSTGFVIQLLTEELDGGSVICRGEFATRRSYIENLANIYSKSNPFLVDTVLQYAACNSFPSPEVSIPFGEPILTLPTSRQSMIYIFRFWSMLLSRLMTRKLFHKDERWGIAFVAGPWRKASLRKGTQVANLPNRYFADPFVVTLDQRTVVFVEDYNFRKKRGCITAIEIIDDKNYQILGPVIEESFHMSFPYIFQYKDDLYMIPETAESKSIRLYKCVQFPLTWVYQKDILSDLRAADSMMFEHDGKWWLFSNIAPTAESDHESQLFAYYSSYPLSDEWVAHDRNPLLVNSNIGRNGGILDVEANNPIRVRQKQGFNFYGRSLTIAKILELTPSSYKEQEISQVLPNFFPELEGCHHIHCNDEYTVYDYVRLETCK